MSCTPNTRGMTGYAGRSAPSVARVYAIVPGVGVCALAMEGFEADDIIGTLATRHASNECQVWIVSSDKDFCQLVTDDIHLLDVGKGKDIGPAEVQERWGVKPNQIIDQLALMGDSSDNIPRSGGGLKKRAATFIQRFGGVEQVLENADVIGGKTGQRIAESRQAVELARQLVTIVTGYGRRRESMT